MPTATEECLRAGTDTDAGSLYIQAHRPTGSNGGADIYTESPGCPPVGFVRPDVGV